MPYTGQPATFVSGVYHFNSAPVTFDDGVNRPGVVGPLLVAAASPNAYARFQWFASSWIGRLILFGYTWSVIHHMLGGIRHLIWDTGRGFGPKEREWLAAASLIGSITITIVLWLFIMLTMGIA